MSTSRPRASTPTRAKKATKKKATKKKATKKKATKKKATKKKATKKTSATTKVTKVKVAKKKVAKKKAKAKVAKKPAPIPDIMKSVPGLRCRECWDVLYSRHPADNRRCGCGYLVVTGPPEAPVARRGEGTPTRLNMTVSRKALVTDYQRGYNSYGRERFPNSLFRHIATRLFPLHFGSSSRRNGSVRRIEGIFKLIQPRSLPEGAPVFRDGANALLWADDKHVWGKVAYIIRDGTAGETLSTTSALMKLISLDLLLEMSYDTKLRAFREGWTDILHRYARENPEWFLYPPPVKDFIFMDVLSHGSASTARGYERGLEGKRRMGKLIPSIMGR